MELNLSICRISCTGMSGISVLRKTESADADGQGDLPGLGLHGVGDGAQVLGQQPLREGLVINGGVLHGETGQTEAVVLALQQHRLGGARSQIHGEHLVALPAPAEKRNRHGFFLAGSGPNGRNLTAEAKLSRALVIIGQIAREGEFEAPVGIGDVGVAHPQGHFAAGGLEEIEQQARGRTEYEQGEVCTSEADGCLAGHRIAQFLHLGQGARIVGAQLHGDDAGACASGEHDALLAGADLGAVAFGDARGRNAGRRFARARCQHFPLPGVGSLLGMNLEDRLAQGRPAQKAGHRQGNHMSVGLVIRVKTG